jgi:hypothetical protein
MRISGITVDPSGEDLTLALSRLESMAAEFEGRNIITDYNFEVEPLTGSLHNLERKFWFAYEANLSVRLHPDFGKQPSPILVIQQQAAYSFLVANTAPFREIKYPARMPIGSHNSRRSLRWSRFYIPEAQAPLSAETIIMYINDIKAFSESFVAYLDAGEVISSYTIEADDGLTITIDANATPLITYTIQADGLTSGGSITLRQVKIVVTTSAGRVETRIINFSLLDSEI